MVISHPNLLQTNPYDDTEVFTISNFCKRNAPHHAENEIEALSRNLLNISFSSSDPKLLNWDPQDPLLISRFIHNTKVHQIYINNAICSNILYEHCFRKLPDT